MTSRQVSYISICSGLFTLFFMWTGPDSFAGLLAFVQLGLIVGAPIAVALRSIVRLWPVTVVLAVGISLALSALASQSLIWFEFASNPAVVALATVYGIVVASLFPRDDPASENDLFGPEPAAERTGRLAEPKTPSSLSERLRPAGLALTVGGAVLALIGGVVVDSRRVDGYGIISALPLVYWVGLALTAIGSVILLDAATRHSHRFVSVIPFAWLLVLHTAPALAHRFVRFNIVYTHMGFVRVIDTRNTGDVLIDARFAWPGLFGSLVPSLPRLDPVVLDIVLRLWPTLITGSVMVLVAALARRSYPTVNLVGTLSAWAYVVLAWTGQDYFSPQGVGLLWYLCLLTVIETGPLRSGPALSAAIPVMPRFAAAGGDRPASRSTLGFVTLLILSFGAIVSHPLAPFFVCTGLLILGIYGRSGAWRLLFIVAVAYFVWVAIAAEPWWSTQLPDLIDQLGGFFSNLQSSTTERVASSSPERLVVTTVRSYVGIGTFLAVFVIGIAMSFARFRHLRPAIPLAPLAGIPALALALQSYGGEIIFRVLLFTLPLAVIVFGRVLAELPERARVLVPTAIALILAPLFLMARFGNEAFEMTTAEDRAAIEAAYEVVSDQTLFVEDNGFTSWREQHIGEAFFTTISASPTQEWLDKMDAVAQDRGKSQIVVVFTPSQAAWREHGMSQPRESLGEIGAWLAEQEGATVLYQQGDAWAVEIEPGF